MSVLKISINDLVNNSNILEKYDYIEIEDKKTHKLKGVFISGKTVDEFKKYLKKQKQKNIQEKLESFNKIIPMPAGSLANKSIQSIKSEMDI